MSRDLSLLEPAFRASVERVLSKVNGSTSDYQLRVFYTLRRPQEQAKLWRQSRSSEQIRTACERLRARGAEWIADTLQSVGPQHGRWATNALPGQSWHQWGRAVDCFVVCDGAAIWDADHRGYQLYAETAEEEGLCCGHFWRKRDSVHVQLNTDRVKDMYTWAEINEHMRKKFGA